VRAAHSPPQTVCGRSGFLASQSSICPKVTPPLSSGGLTCAPQSGRRATMQHWNGRRLALADDEHWSASHEQGGSNFGSPSFPLSLFLCFSRPKWAHLERPKTVSSWRPVGHLETARTRNCRSGEVQQRLATNLRGERATRRKRCNWTHLFGATIGSSFAAFARPSIRPSVRLSFVARRPTTVCGPNLHLWPHKQASNRHK